MVPLAGVVAGGVEFSPSSPPAGLAHHPELGIVCAKSAAARRIHLDDFVCHPRATITPGGEYLLFHAAGPMHYGWARKARKGNTMLARRSPDRGRTWGPPSPAWDVPYSQHAAIPFIPRGSSTIYAFGTEPRPDAYDGEENAAIGFRTSRDDGRTWSEVRLIRPVNAPDYQGMSAMRMCEAEDGTWLLGSHAGHWSGREGVDRRVRTRQYVLRSENRGETWVLLPGPWPGGWVSPEYDRLEEGRLIHLGQNRVLLMARSPTGVLWELRSPDAGRTWSDPKPTSLAHPDAPPMLFHLDGRGTLIAFHHNRNVKGHFAHENRSELWASLSSDDGRTWSEPRLLVVNAAQPAILNGWGGWTPMVSYADLLVDGEDLHLFVDHQMRQILHLVFSRRSIETWPTRGELAVREK